MLKINTKPKAPRRDGQHYLGGSKTAARTTILSRLMTNNS